ncbi:hypothetical protein C8R46DRAFT_1253135, partial [Mycena filopes]
GKACFVIELDDKEFRGSLRGQDSLACTKCHPEVLFSLKNKQLILQHNGAHILFDPSINRSDQPCGLCLRPFPLCNFVLTTGQGTDSARQVDWKRSTCLRQLTFSMAAAMKSTPTAPCTNYLIACPLRCGLVVWTYNLEAHYRSSRHGLASLTSVPVPYSMAPQELAGMKKIYQDRAVQSRPRTLKKKSQPQLLTSDTHSSRLAMRTLDEEDPPLPVPPESPHLASSSYSD